MNLVFQLVLAVLAIGIAVQDFRSRLVSLWLLLVFSGIGFTLFLQEQSWRDLAANALFCLAYLSFLFLVITVYYYLKKGHFEKIIDRKVGMADIILLILAGSTLQPAQLVYFYTISFLLSLLLFLLLFRTKNSVPLAGFLSLFYVVYLFVAGQLPA